MALRDYLVTEIGFDHRDGLLTRREALRRLGLLGLGAAAATSVLAACGGDDKGGSAGESSSTAAGSPATGTSASTAAPAPPTSTNASSSVPGPLTEEAQAIMFPGPAGTLQGRFAAAEPARGGVLIIHENRGLTAHFKALPNRFAASGYSALAIDLLSRQGGTDAIGDEGRVTAALGATPAADLVADLRAGVDELQRRAANEKLAVVGFCFGGGQVWSLLAAGEPRLAAAVPFYGPGPQNPDFSGSKAAVLGIYAEKDSRVNGTKDAMDAALTAAGLPHELRVFPGVDHAFFNDTGARYDAAQAMAAYQATMDWFGRHL
jgi:carboxymethylenebutenolidase